MSRFHAAEFDFGRNFEDAFSSKVFHNFSKDEFKTFFDALRDHDLESAYKLLEQNGVLPHFRVHGSDDFDRSQCRGQRQRVTGSSAEETGTAGGGYASNDNSGVWSPNSGGGSSDGSWAPAGGGGSSEGVPGGEGGGRFVPSDAGGALPAGAVDGGYGRLFSSETVPREAQYMPSDLAENSERYRAMNTIPEAERRDFIIDCLKIAGAPVTESNIRAVDIIISHESPGWLVNAVNDYDINWQKGDPSQGLMQVTGETFSGYSLRGLSGDIQDPYANCAAAINYILGEYAPDGDLTRVPGVHNVLQGYGYVWY